jgi:RimJ/RimL family protein N-acetyltransferase
MSLENEYLTIRALRSEDSPALSILLRSQPPDYAHFFYAFSFDEATIRKLLSDCRRDHYAGIFWQQELVGFFMLRGWDMGYEVPSFGVLIDEKYRGGALMKLALDAAKLISRKCGAPHLMAKIHPDNVSIRGARRLGFVQVGHEPETGNIIYHLEL